MTPTKDHCLNGITRQSVIQIAKDLNYDVIEKNLTFDDLISADEAFFTGTAVEITPISKVDDVKIGHDGAGEITKVLQKKFSLLCLKINFFFLYLHHLEFVLSSLI